VFREKKTDRLPQNVSYDYEGSASNSKFDSQINRNAFFHSRGNREIGRLYGPNVDLKKNKK